MRKAAGNRRKQRVVSLFTLGKHCTTIYIVLVICVWQMHVTSTRVLWNLVQYRCAYWCRYSQQHRCVYWCRYSHPPTPKRGPVVPDVSWRWNEKDGLIKQSHAFWPTVKIEFKSVAVHARFVAPTSTHVANARHMATHNRTHCVEATERWGVTKWIEWV